MRVDIHFVKSHSEWRIISELLYMCRRHETTEQNRLCRYPEIWARYMKPPGDNKHLNRVTTVTKITATSRAFAKRWSTISCVPQSSPSLWHLPCHVVHARNCIRIISLTFNLFRLQLQLAYQHSQWRNHLLNVIFSDAWYTIWNKTMGVYSSNVTQLNTRSRLVLEIR